MTSKNRERPDSHNRADELDDTVQEIALIGELSENESDITEKLIALEPDQKCILYINSPGGSVYSALSLMTLIQLRGIPTTAIVTGECSSAALLPFAACDQRFVTPFSVLLFHPMKWQSEEHCLLHEASEWTRHFATLEKSTDTVLADLLNVPHAVIEPWLRESRYVTGRELADAGLAELIAPDAVENWTRIREID